MASSNRKLVYKVAEAATTRLQDLPSFNAIKMHMPPWRSACYVDRRTNAMLAEIYKKYSARRLVEAGTARWSSGTAEKMANLGLMSSARFMMDATLPQR